MFAVTAVFATTLSPTPVDAGLIDGLRGPIEDLVDDLLGVVDHTLRPVTGLVSDLTGLPIDDAVSDLVEGVVDGLVGTMADLLLAGEDATLGDPGFEDLIGIVPLEPADLLIEDVIYPGVLEPTAVAIAPVVGVGALATGQLGLELSEVTSIDGLPALLEPLGLDAAVYTVRATGPEGLVTEEGLIDVPTLVDVDGDGLDDISVELRILTAQPSLRVIKLPTAPASLPLAVDVVLAPGGYQAPERLAFGYDALDSQAPGVFRASVTDLGTSSGNLAVDVHAVTPGSSVALVASVYDQGANATRIAPTDIRLGFAPVPADASVLASGLNGDTASGRVRVEVSEPSTVSAAVATTATNGDRTEIGASIDQVPGFVDLAVAQAGDGVSLDYEASAPVDNITLHIAQTEDGITNSVAVGFEGISATSASFVVSADEIGYSASADIDAITLEVIDPRGIIDRATVLRARLEGLPAALDIDIADGGAIGLSAGSGQLDLLEIQLLDDPARDIALAPGTNGVIFRDLPAEYTVFVRLTGLRSVSLTPTPDLTATIETVGGNPFVASIAQADQSVDARLSALPSSVTIGLVDGPTGATLSYDASSVVDLLEIDLVQDALDASLVVEALPTSLDVTLSDAGIEWVASSGAPLITAQINGAEAGFGDATEIRARLEAVPATFRITLADGTVELDAPDGIGLVEILATDGVTEIGVPDGVDGLILVDTPDAFAAALRLTGLRAISFSADPLALQLDTIGDRVFQVAVDQQADDGSGTAVAAVIDRLPASVSLSLTDLETTPTLVYRASATVDSLIASVISTREDGGESTIGLNVAGLPEALTIALGEETVTYSASAVVPSLVLEVNDSDGLVDRATRLLVSLTDLPTDFTVGLVGESLSFDAGTGTLGSLDALITSGPELGLAPGVDGLLLIDNPDDFVAAVHIEGLQAISFGLDDAAEFSVRTVGGRLFDVDVRQSGADGSSTELRATLDRLPSEVTLSLGGAIAGGGGEGLALDYVASAVMDELRADFTTQAAGEPATVASLRLVGLPTELSLGLDDDGSITYTASSRVPELSLDLTDPAGFFGAATTLRLRALDLPTGITASVDPAGGLTATTSGGALGSLEALFTSGDEIGLDGALDGIVLRDTPDLFAAFVRITGLTGIEFTPADGGTRLGIDTLGGRVFVADILTENVDTGARTVIDATLDALPSSVLLDLSNDIDAGISLDYTASAQMARLAGSVELTDADGTTVFDLEVLDLPTAVTFALDSETGALNYAGSDRVGQLSIVAENAAGIFQTATRLQAVLTDLPTELEISLGGEEGGAAISLDAKGGQLGLLEVLATSGPNIAPAPGVDGVVIRDTADDFVLGMRIHDLRQIVVQPDPVAFTIGTAGGETFVIDAVLDGGQVIDLGDGAIDLQATFSPLPESVTLGFGLDGGSQALTIDSTDVIDDVNFSLVQTPATGTPLTAAIAIEDVPNELALAIDVTGAVSYTASAPVPSLQVDAEDPAGLFDRADKLSLRLTGLPLGLDVALSDTGSVVVSTTGGRLGQLEALAWLNSPTALAAGIDGVVLEDLVSDYRVFARFTDIEVAEVSQVPQPSVRLVGAGGRPISIGLYESAPGKPSAIPNVAYTTATLVNAPPTVNLALLEGDPGTINVAYDASATAQALTFQTNSGDRWITSATIANPVPKHFLACQTGTSSCAPGLGQTTANIGSFSFNADEHTTLSVLDCAAPLNANCTPQNGTKFTHVNNLRVKDFQFTGHINQGTVQADGRIYANTVPPGMAYNSTNATTLSGTIANRDGDTKLNFTFGNNFKAWDRYRRFDRFPSLPFFGMRIRESRGGISCTSGTNLSVTVKFVFNLTFNANDLLC